MLIPRDEETHQQDLLLFQNKGVLIITLHLLQVEVGVLEMFQDQALEVLVHQHEARVRQDRVVADAKF